MTTLTKDIATKDLKVGKTSEGEIVVIDQSTHIVLGMVGHVPLRAKFITFGLEILTVASGADYDFDCSAVNHTQQNQQLVGAIPANAQLVAAYVFNTTALEDTGGAGTLQIEVGSAEAGGQYITLAGCDGLAGYEIIESAAGSFALAAVAEAAADVWVGADPSVNWSTLTAGAWLLMLLYLDFNATIQDYKV